MKKSFTILSLVAFPFFGYPQQGTYVVQGQLAIQKIPEWAYLLSDNPAQVLEDSVEIRDGSFMFSGVLNRPVKASLFTGKSLKQAQTGFCLTFYLEPDTVFMRSPDTLKHMQVDGGRENRCFQELLQQLRPAYEQLEIFGKEYRSDIQQYVVLPGDALADNRQHNNARRQHFRDIEALHWRLTKQFVKNHPDSVVSLDALIMSARNNQEAKDVPLAMNLLSPRLRNAAPDWYH